MPRCRGPPEPSCQDHDQQPNHHQQGLASEDMVFCGFRRKRTQGDGLSHAPVVRKVGAVAAVVDAAVVVAVVVVVTVVVAVVVAAFLAAVASVDVAVVSVVVLISL